MKVNIIGKGIIPGVNRPAPVNNIDLTKEQVARIINFKQLRVFSAADHRLITKDNIRRMFAAASREETAKKLDALSKDVDALLSKGKLVVENLADNTKEYFTKFSEVATRLKTDLSGAYKVYAGDGWNDSSSIANDTFKDVTSLKEIIIPPYVSSLGNNVFRNTGLTHLEINSNVTTVGNDTVSYCTDLKELTINSRNLVLKSGFAENDYNLEKINLIAVYEIQTAAFIKTGIKELTIPDGTYKVNTGQTSCPNLEKVTFLGFTTIGDNAFVTNPKLKTVNMSSRMANATISSSAFASTEQGGYKTIGVTFNISTEENAISGAPWGCEEATVNWNANIE